MKKLTVIIISIVFSIALYSKNSTSSKFTKITSKDIKVGAERTELYFPKLKGKYIAVVANQTSMLGKTHLVDTLFNSGFKLIKIFCPEHGFRGEAGAGEYVSNAVDNKTGLPIFSLYGKNRKPNSAQLKEINVIIFDLQDVGARFYTYISTMHYVMEACAENDIELIILDRPNPNGHYVDGPVLKDKYKSFVGMHPVPIVHGMTVGEYAQMINGEKWLKKGIQCKLTVIPVEKYTHKMQYQLPIKPSPNLADMNAVYLYPSLCLFEGTVVSVGRGTNKPFRVFGHPDFTLGDYKFTPHSIPGVSENPKLEGKICNGFDLTEFAANYFHSTEYINLFWLMQTYNELKEKTTFFNNFFDKLAGNSELREQIIAGVSEEKIRESWQPDLDKFKKIRKKYLLYPDFD